MPPPQVLYEGVPDHLVTPLRRWIYHALGGGGAELVALRLNISIDYSRAGGDGGVFLSEDPQPDELLDVVDAILQLGGPWPVPSDSYTASEGVTTMRRNLRTILDAGSSAWRVNSNFDGFERRVDASATEAALSAADVAADNPATGSASDQIRSSWAKLYGLNPDAPAAYGAAIRAVESAAHAIVEPNNPRATLGTMLGQLRANPERYELAIPGPDQTGDVAPLIKMMELLWTGQTSRHGSRTAMRPETQDEAAMAVHLAVVLVHWFSTGAVWRKT